jgi:formate C-acetyltransferase
MSNTTQSVPLAIEPCDKEWGVGVSGLIENPSPFPRINRMLKWLKALDSTADSQRALIVTECDAKYAMYPQNIKWALTLREIFERVEINIWPEELIVGELAAPPKLRGSDQVRHLRVQLRILLDSMPPMSPGCRCCCRRASR